MTSAMSHISQQDLHNIAHILVLVQAGLGTRVLPEVRSKLKELCDLYDIEPPKSGEGVEDIFSRVQKLLIRLEQEGQDARPQEG